MYWELYFNKADLQRGMGEAPWFPGGWERDSAYRSIQRGGGKGREKRAVSHHLSEWLLESPCITVSSRESLWKSTFPSSTTRSV